jgi:hypothetical protein
MGVKKFSKAKATVNFYSEAVGEKGQFIAVESKLKWY